MITQCISFLFLEVFIDSTKFDQEMFDQIWMNVYRQAMVKNETCLWIQLKLIMNKG